MDSQKKRKSLGSKIASLFSARDGSQKSEESKKRSTKYRIMYQRFREILAINDASLQLIADIDDKLLGLAPFNLEPTIARMKRAVGNVFLMINGLNEISQGRYLRLYDALSRLQIELDVECTDSRLTLSGPTILPLSELRASHSRMVGSKMANLGELRTLGYNIPEGFAITTAAFARFMSYNNLWDRAIRLESIMESFTPALLEKACREVQMTIHSSVMPPDMESEIFGAYDELAKGEKIQVAVRSSAVGEDGSASHAGQYYTELNVSRDLLLDSYRTVLASMFKSDAMQYRFERGLLDGEDAMAVGCICMVDPRVSGIMFSREFDDLDKDSVVISTRRGLSAGITSGTMGAEEIVITADLQSNKKSEHLSQTEIDVLRQTARDLEKHFGSPQDIEWAIDNAGKMFLLQSRPMVTTRSNITAYSSPAAKGVGDEGFIKSEPILSGGYVACPGVGAGPVYYSRTEADLERFPDGGVVVARHSSPAFSRIMTRCAAIITEIGSPIGHMAILAREFGVPAIVGLAGAISSLEPGTVVTVDATSRQVFKGDVLEGLGAKTARFPLADAPVVHKLRRISRLISPLTLTDPTSPNFTAAGCKSLHDITRFVHEKVYEVMFRFGDRAEHDKQNSFRLEAHLPLDIRVFDVGGGVADGCAESGVCRPEEILSIPMIAFMEGLLDKRIKWDQPRPVSARGFLSVLGENIAGPPAEAKGVGSASFVVISDRYMNFSTKAGYHFSTVDVYCGNSQNKNYVHFRFEKGGASLERRLRRVLFINEVLTALDFKVKFEGDFLIARLDKYDPEFITSRLAHLGRLTLCARQLDMLMDSDAKASTLAQAFLREEFHKF